MLKPIQLRCFYTGKEAPEPYRSEIQARIDRMEESAKQALAEGKPTLASSYRHSILILKGTLRPVRA